MAYRLRASALGGSPPKRADLVCAAAAHRVGSVRGLTRSYQL